MKIRGGPIFRVQQKVNKHTRQAEDAKSRKERESLLLRGLFTQLTAGSYLSVYERVADRMSFPL